jgi:hypothetical protein
MLVGYKVSSRFQESKGLSKILRKVKTVCENPRIAGFPSGMGSQRKIERPGRPTSLLLLRRVLPGRFLSRFIYRMQFQFIIN